MKEHQHETKTVTFRIEPMSVLVVLGMVAAASVLLKIVDVIFIIFTAIIIASVTEPTVEWLQRRYRLKHLVAVVITYVTLFVVFGIFIAFFVPLFLGQMREFFAVLPTYLEGVLSRSGATIESTTGIGNAAGDVVEGGLFSAANIAEDMYASLGNISSGAFKTAGNIFSHIISGVFVFSMAFYLSIQRDGVANFIDLITPVKHADYVKSVWRRSQRKISQWMQGQIISGVLAGLLVMVALMIIGVPYALTFGVFTAVMELVPMFGAFLSAAPIIMIAFVVKGPWIGVATAVVLIIIQQVQANIIYPYVAKRTIGVSPLIVIIAIAIGIKVAGFFGALLSVPFAAIIMEILGDMRMRHIKEMKQEQLKEQDVGQED